MSDPLIPDYNRRNLVVQPHTTRSRARFRGVLKSEQWNLEAEQIRFDIAKLRSQLEHLRSEIDESLDVIGTFDDLLAKILNLQERVRRLEIQKGLKL